MVCSPRLRTVAHPLTPFDRLRVSGTRAHSAAIVLPAQAGEPRPCLPGESRGVSPLARGLGDVPPVIKKLPRAGGGAQPTSQCRPKSPPGPCPCLVSLCRFRAIFRRGPRPTFGPRPTYSPFSTVSTPPSGALGPSSGPCLADTTRLPLSTCPSRLNPKLRRPLPGTGRPEKRSAQFKASQTHPCAHRHRRGKGAGPAPKDDHHKVQSHFNGPASAVVQRPQGVGAGLALLDGGVGAPG